MNFPRVLLFAATSICAVSSIALAQFPAASGPAGKALGAPPRSSPTAIVLYDQTDNPTGSNGTSQDFEASLDPFDAEAADDFVVPSGVVWSVTGAYVAGAYNTGPAAAVNLTFAADAAGVPGGAVCSYPLQTPADAAGSFTFTLATPCVLTPGTYWMIVQARQDFTPAGQWFWNTRSVQSNSVAMWRNPGDGFGTGCTTFSPLTPCIPTAGGPDLIFSISGTPGGVSPPAPPECAASTAYFENLVPVPIPESGGPVATSTINVSGLTGTIWDVNVVTQIVHTYPGDLDMTIQSPAGTIVTLSTDNAVSNDDVFDGTVWDDQANPGGQVPYANNPGLVNDNPYTIGVTAPALAPEEALAAFNGEDPNGTWTITIDDDAGGDVGTLNGWALQITTRQGGITTVVQSTPSNSTPVPIPDSGGPTAVSTIDASFHPGTFVCGIRPTINITHTAPGDLDITLMSPSGRIVTLSSDNGGGNDDVFAGTTFDDDANPGGQVPYGTNDGLVNDTAYVSGTPVPLLVPEEALALFTGDDPRGVWTLTIDDDTAGDTGTLNSWSLEIRTCTCAAAEQDNPVRVDEHVSSGSSNLNGVFETGENVLFEPSWLNPGSTPFDLSFAVTQNFTGPAGATYTIVDNLASYGALGPGVTANCFDASGNCYELSITSGSRPAQHWDASILEAVFEISGPQRQDSPEVTGSWTLHVGESFPDVPTANIFYRFIETIFHKGVTGGCGAANYCPGDFTLRKQMAVFVLKSKEGSGYAPPPAVGIFTDVPAADPFAPWIEELYNRGVVAGCGAGPSYCPNNPVLRQQMAVFLLKTLLGSGYTPPAAVGLFGDVPISNPFAPWIEDLFNRGIAAGCGGGNFCPTNSTTRGQMAPFLVKTFGLLLYGV